VAKVGDGLRVLDLQQPSGRQAVLAGTDAKRLYERAEASDY